MTLLVALLIASSFVHDGVRDYLIHLVHRVEPKTNAKEGRNHRYLPFTLRRLPPPLPSSVLLTQDQTALHRSLLTVHRSVQRFFEMLGVQPRFQPLQVYLQHTWGRLQSYLRLYPLSFPFSSSSSSSSTLSSLPALDTLPFPAPSVSRRALAWMIDSFVVYTLTSSLKGTGLRSTMASLLWLSRDFWLSGWGHQSIGRWCVGQVALSTDLVHHLNRECAPVITPSASSSSSSSSDSSSTVPLLPPVHPFEMASHLHDQEINALLIFNSLRLFLTSLGPLAMVTYFITSAPALVYGNGRSIWDRWTHMQVVDIEVLNTWTHTGEVTFPNSSSSSSTSSSSSSSSSSFKPFTHATASHGFASSTSSNLWESEVVEKEPLEIDSSTFPMASSNVDMD